MEITKTWYDAHCVLTTIRFLKSGSEFSSSLTLSLLFIFRLAVAAAFAFAGTSSLPKLRHGWRCLANEGQGTINNYQLSRAFESRLCIRLSPPDKMWVCPGREMCGAQHHPLGVLKRLLAKNVNTQIRTLQADSQQYNIKAIIHDLNRIQAERV